MRVLFFHHASSYGGSSRSLGILLPFLANKGVEVWVSAPDGPACEYFRTVTENVIPIDRQCVRLSMTVVGMKNNLFHFLMSFTRYYKKREIRKIIGDISPDIVHCNEIGLLRVAKIARSMGVKVVMHARTMPHKDFQRINRWVISRVNKYCDYLICISGSVEKAFESVNTMRIVYNPLETDQTGKSPVREKNKVIFLSLSAIQETKGVFDIVESARILRNESHIKFKIAGALVSQDATLISSKQKLLVKLGILDFTTADRFLSLIEKYNLENIELLGHVSDVNSEIRKADVMLAPMHLNAPPRSVYEAGALGIPAILSMEDKVEDIVEHDVTGILIDEMNPEQLSASVLKFANDTTLREKMGAAAQKKCLANHEPSACAAEILKVYESLLVA